MNARTNLSAFLSVVAVAALSTSAFAGDVPQRVTEVKGTQITEIDVPHAAPYNPDYNVDGQTDMRDIFDFLTGWFAGKPSADVDGDGQLTGLDVLEYLNVWFGYTPVVPTEGKK